MAYHTENYGDGDNTIELLLMDEPMMVGDKALVGMVTSSRFPKRVGLVLDQEADDERDYDFAALAIGAEDTPFVYMEQIVSDGLRAKSDESLSILFHELGHYHYGHRPKGVEERYTERLSKLKEGNVLPTELAADGFAAEYLGVDVILSGFAVLRQHMAERYSEEAGYDPETIEMALAELDKRIENLKQMSR